MPSDPNRDYPIRVMNVGGKEPDGKPTRLGKWTFSTKMVRDVVLSHIDGEVLNACAGETELSKNGVEIHRNDLNEDIDADTHYDVRKIDEQFSPASFDTVVNDPPFDAGRAEKLYEGFHASGYIDARDALSRLVKPGGTYIELGWNSWGLSRKDGWERTIEYQYRQPFKGDVHLLVEHKVDQKTVGDF